MFLLLMIFYVFSVLFTQAVSDYVAKSDSEQRVDGRSLQPYWGSLFKSMFTLFQSIAGGISWKEAVSPLADINAFWVFCFVVFISFTIFAVLNVVTGVFCQSAIDSAQLDHESVINDHLKAAKLFGRRVGFLFDQLDTDDSG